MLTNSLPSLSLLPALYVCLFGGADNELPGARPSPASDPCALSLAQKPLSLEASKFVVSDQAIELPAPAGYRVINASMAAHAGQYWAAYRVDPIAPNEAGCGQRVAFAQLDQHFQPMSQAQLLETSMQPGTCSTAEDPRLLSHGDRLFVVYNSTADGQVYRTQRDIYLLELDVSPAKGDQVAQVVRRKQLRMANGHRKLTEKNWTPFVYDDELHFAYQTNPPYIGRLSKQTWESPGTIAQLSEASRGTAKVAEPFGTMRGGTPAVEVPGLGFLSFFHTFMLVGGSDRDPYTAIYMAGAYTFDAEPPFAINRIMTVPLVPATAYDDLDLLVGGGKKLGWITYPQGIILDGPHAHVSYSQNDRRVRVMTVNIEAMQHLMLGPAPADKITR